MASLPQLVSDLALILIIAGITTLLCRRLKQPLILGYILAGLLTGPHTPIFAAVSDHASIDTWSTIGVIFIMFTLGLEFSFKRVVKMGLSPIIAAISIVFFMISIGSGVGHLFGWTSMNSLFLGGMLAMSSTTIIYKALGELGLREHKFAGIVLGVLILEDILGILLMVLLSALAVSSKFEGTQLLLSFFQLGFFLILWFVVGIYLVPLILRRASKFISSETLLIVSVGLCFLMVVLATRAGYSSAFGAFMMGSILAETIQAEKISKVVAPVKDLFGAIFFISVGMLVDPSIIMAYSGPIAVIVISIIFGQVIFGTLGFLISGHSLKVSMQCSFSMTQIGEFSFILAALGVSLGVTDKFLYPVVVAASVITTFTTPYMMRLAKPCYHRLVKILPKQWVKRLKREEEERTTSVRAAQPSLSRSWTRSLLINVATYSVLVVALIAMSLATLLPLSRGFFGHWMGNTVCGLMTYASCAIFLRPIVMKKLHSSEVEEWRRSKNRFWLWYFDCWILLRFVWAAAMVYYILNFLSPFRWYWHILGAIILTMLFCLERFHLSHSYILNNRFAKWIKFISIHIERTFMSNLCYREQQRANRTPGYVSVLRRHDIHLVELHIPENSSWGGCSLSQLRLGEDYNVMVTAVLRGGGRINIPDGSTQIFPGDILEALGDDDNLCKLAHLMRKQIAILPENIPDNFLSLSHFTVKAGSALSGKRLSESGIRQYYQCMVVGFEDEEESGKDFCIRLPSADRIILPGDTIWLVGKTNDVAALESL